MLEDQSADRPDAPDRPDEDASPFETLARVLDPYDNAVGGGSASALAGAMAAGLLGMVARLSVDRDFELADERYRAIADEADELRRALVQGAAEDSAVYAVVKDAYGLPKSTDEEKARRGAAIHDALIGAAEVPRDNAHRCARVLDLCREIVGRSNESAASDLAVAVEFARVGIIGCAGNIDVNVSMLEGERAEKLLDEAEELRKRC
jgi:methenyltetrahydrofolate cyclohydrolase